MLMDKYGKILSFTYFNLVEDKIMYLSDVVNSGTGDVSKACGFVIN